MNKDGKTTDNGRTRQKYCCPFKNSKTACCPCNHKNWKNGKKSRCCFKYITIPDDYRLSIDRELCFLQKDLRFTNRSRTLQRTVQANRAGASMGSQLQFSSKPQHYCTYCLAGYRCCSNCHLFRLLRSLSKKREKNRLNLIFHIFNGRCAVLPYGLVCCALLILFLVFFVICSLRSVCFAHL